MRSDIMDLTVIQDQDPIRMDHRRNSLCNDDFCHIAKFFQLFADLLFRRRIDCTGRIIKDQDLRIGKKCSCDTESLFLPAGQVISSLHKHGVQSVRKTLQELIRTCHTACMPDFFVICIRIAPFQVITYRSGKKLIFLQNNSDCRPQCMKIICFYIHTANSHRAAGRIIKPRDQLHERRFGGSGSTDHTDRLPGLDVQINI